MASMAVAFSRSSSIWRASSARFRARVESVDIRSEIEWRGVSLRARAAATCGIGVRVALLHKWAMARMGPARGGALGGGDRVAVRHPEPGHPVERRVAQAHGGALPGGIARGQAGPEEQLVARDRRLHEAPPVVAHLALPAPPPDPADPPHVLVAVQRGRLGVPVLPDVERVAPVAAPGGRAGARL